MKTVAVVVAALVALTVLLVVCTVYAVRNKHKDSAVATALYAGGWAVYVREGCGPCAAQKKTLAEIGFGRVVNHDASGRRVGALPPGVPEAPPGGLKAFPTWLQVPTGYQVRGAKTALELSVLAMP